ncbi:hypothetical protein A2415_02195 [candidate division WWE3 bacterium RIFOXYC1_FULL_39_7]|uniref:Uncharacterized protein n=2 Tax=Katanobacteria TaxID=422282 RepID=A0A1F4X928_UNCKA|nr:MAG: hypothetical protein A2415_02195 [candidate division WWE3 bacterium RIFOXYC1_FULL_39_7]OGC78172.1 MAG: hypothetical protein A2619_01785 [candidate division WWE3 bacterium RIFOXYD1_FULL_39_9]
MKKIGKYLGILVIPLLFGAFFYSQFLHIDISNSCAIFLMPTFQPSNLSTKETVSFLQKSSATEYAKLCKHVSVINKNAACGGLDGGCYQPSQPKTIFIGNDQNNIALAAALLVHETCHAIQGQSNETLSEGPCYKAGAEYLQSILIKP